MLVTALKADVDAYVAAHTEERDGAGHTLVVRNGVARSRKVTTSAGSAAIRTRAVAVPARTAAPHAASAPSVLVVISPWSRRYHAPRTVSTSSTNGPAAVSGSSTSNAVRAAAASSRLVAVTCPTCDEPIQLSELLEQLP